MLCVSFQQLYYTHTHTERDEDDVLLTRCFIGQESGVTSFSFFGILKMNVSAEKREGFLVDVIHLLDDAAQTKAKLNQFCSYFSKFLKENESRLETNSHELKRLRAWATASYVSLSLSL